MCGFADRCDLQKHLKTQAFNVLKNTEAHHTSFIKTAKSSQDPDTDQEFTTVEINAAILRLKLSAPGDDGISNAFISHSTPSFRARLLELFNLSWVTGKLPSVWKTAKIVPIPKGKIEDGHRPISLLSCLGKLLERMINTRIVNKVGPLNSNLHAFH